MTSENTNTAAKSAITLAHLKRALKVIEPACARKSTIPILQSIRMEQLPDGLAIDATDLDIAIRALVAETNGPANSIVIPAERFFTYVRLLKGEEVAISTTTARATMKCAGAKGVFPLLPSANWPVLDFKPSENGVTLKQGVLARALRFAQIAVCEDESRYTLRGIQITGDGERLRAVATDGHTLMLYTFPCEEKIQSLLLPSDISLALLPLLTDDEAGVDLTFTASTILAAIAGEMPIFVNGKQIQGSFPNWEAVMPKDKRTVINVDARVLLEALERASSLADQRSFAVKFTFGPDGVIVLDAADANAGEAQEIVPCDGTLAETLCMGINATFLTGLLKKLSGAVAIHVPADAQKPLLFKAEPHEEETLDYIVMPMRV
jgi:DNA polymerase-3 subunit beta